MARHTPHISLDDRLTVEDLTLFWQQYDERLAAEDRHRPPHSQVDWVMAAAWCAFVVVVSTIVAGGVLLMRVVGG